MRKNHMGEMQGKSDQAAHLEPVRRDLHAIVDRIRTERDLIVLYTMAMELSRNI